MRKLLKMPYLTKRTQSWLHTKSNHFIGPRLTLSDFFVCSWLGRIPQKLLNKFPSNRIWMFEAIYTEVHRKTRSGHLGMSVFYTIHNHLKPMGKAIIFCHCQSKPRTLPNSPAFTFTVSHYSQSFFWNARAQSSCPVHSSAPPLPVSLPREASMKCVSLTCENDQGIWF